MTKQQWVECTDLKVMFTFLGEKPTQRQWRFFVVACCRHVWHLLADDRSKKAIQVAEQFEDGLVPLNQLRPSEAAAAEAARDAVPRDRPVGGSAGTFAAAPEYCALAAARAEQCAAKAAVKTVVLITAEEATFASGFAIMACGEAREAEVLLATERAVGQRQLNPIEENVLARRAEEAWQISVLRDIVGNPFRAHPFIKDDPAWPEWDPAKFAWNPAWLAWNERAVPRIAQAIYENRTFDRMPILGDALQDAGCDNEDILKHCRSTDQHVRGCWVLDLLLGKE